MPGLTCNPTVDRIPFPRVGFIFRMSYEWCLFKEGVAEVLRDELRWVGNFCTITLYIFLLLVRIDSKTEEGHRQRRHVP